MTKPEGFAHQRLVVLPRPLAGRMLDEPGTGHLLVTDCGYFPEAKAHGIARPAGTEQAVVILCVRGRGWLRLGDESFDVEAGQVLVIPPHTEHAYGADRATPWTIWWLHVTGADLPDLLETIPFTRANPIRDIGDAYRLAGLIEEIVRGLEQDITPHSILAASGAAWHLLALLSSSRKISASGSASIAGARQYLQTHFADQISVRELAEMANLSTSHFAALFRQQCGVPVLQFQSQLRMSRARELLDTTDLSVASIARAVGFEDASYFSRQFSIVHEQSPRQYRIQHKG